MRQCQLLAKGTLLIVLSNFTCAFPVFRHFTLRCCVSSISPSQQSMQSEQHQAAIEFANLIGRLKTTPRTGWVRRGVPAVESVADHSWRVASLSLLVGDSVDCQKVMQMGVLHDLAECIIGDLCPEDNVSKAEKQERENQAVEQLVGLLEQAQSKHIGYFVDMLHEYEKRQSKEARAVKDLDLLDMILQADQYEMQHNVDLSDFFSSTHPSKFHNERIRNIAEAVHAQRQERLQQENVAVNVRDQSDNSFAVDFARSANMSEDDVKRVVRALREHDKRNGR